MIRRAQDIKMDRLMEDIKVSEGFRSATYKDTLGHLTIGYGFKIDALSKDELALNDNNKNYMPRDIAHKILQIKLNKLSKELFYTLTWLPFKLATTQEVVIEMGYQLGVAKLLKFKNTLRYIKDDDVVQASINMRNSLWYKQTPNRVENLIKKLLKGHNEYYKETENS